VGKARHQKANRDKHVNAESDHITLINLYRAWKKASNPRQFVLDHGLNGHSFAQ